MSKNIKIKHPTTGNYEFGLIPLIKGSNYYIRKGYIYLRGGKHVAKNRGFGLTHIWEEHQNELMKLGYLTKEGAIRYVADIIRTGSNIHYEYGNRLTIVDGGNGIAVIEEKSIGGEIEYSVVTAYPKKNPHGSLIGKLQDL